MNVAVLDDVHEAYGQTAGVERLRQRATVRIFTDPVADPGVLRGFDALIANRERTRFTRAWLEQVPEVRIIAQTGNHAYHIDFEAAHDLGVVIARASGGYSIGAAELAIGLAMAVMRQIPVSDRAVREGRWVTPTTPVMHGKTLGIIGLGRIGRHVARIATGLGMRVLAWSPRLTESSAREGLSTRVELDALLAEADVVSVHASLTPESKGLLDERRLRVMKPTAYLVNVSRGPVVDEAALVSALSNGRLAGAGLDVFDREPLPADHPLTRLTNVVLTPHLGWPTDAGYASFADAACDVLLAHLDGLPVPTFDH